MLLSLRYLPAFLISYFFFVRPVPADQSPQVLEHATPLAAEMGDRPAPRVRKTPASDAGRSAEPVPKRQKTSGTGPSRKKRKNEIPTSSG